MLALLAALDPRDDREKVGHGRSFLRLTEDDVDNTDEITRDRLTSTIRGLRRR